MGGDTILGAAVRKEHTNVPLVFLSVASRIYPQAKLFTADLELRPLHPLADLLRQFLEVLQAQRYTLRW